MGSLTDRPLRVLISGAGIAGPSLAFWLSRLGHSCTVVERAGQLRANGQQIDIRGQGVEAARRMGLLDEIRKAAVDEQGVRFVDTRGRAIASFPKLEARPGEDPGRQGFSSEFEIMRGDLCRLLVERTGRSTEYVFGKHVVGFRNGADCVAVTFSDGEEAAYDVLVAADGQGSRIRRMLLERAADPSADYSRDLGVYLAYFTMPREEDDSNVASVHITDRRRILGTRFHSETEGQGYLATMARADDIREALGQDADAQRALFADMFRGAGWQSERLVRAMHKADDFYAMSTTQIRSRIWSSGRVVCLGDAGYGPTPLTGMGTSLALIGAYVLAGEMAASPDDPAGVFASYEAVLRPFVDEVQHISWGVPGLLYPETRWGVRVLQFLLAAVSFLRLERLFQTLTLEGSKWEMPRYSQLEL
ncbi:hypothetical protein E4U41_000097 [Claviceps citrina]|nr:hypothetical protein E4U41_000097 [Claviceps citrina]